jgi:hypothetical protein
VRELLLPVVCVLLVACSAEGEQPSTAAPLTTNLVDVVPAGAVEDSAADLHAPAPVDPGGAAPDSPPPPAPLRPEDQVASLALDASAGARAPHLTAAGELLWACGAGGTSLCRHAGGAGAEWYGVDLDLDGELDAAVRAGAAAVVVLTLPPGSGPIRSIASDDAGGVYFAVAGDPAGAIRALAADGSAPAWQVGCPDARLAAGGGHLYAACGDELRRFELASGAGEELIVRGLPADEVVAAAWADGFVHLATAGEVGRFPAEGGDWEPLAGTGASAGWEAPAGDGTQALEAPIRATALGVDPLGRVFFADARGDRAVVRYRDAHGELYAVAGLEVAAAGGLAVRGDTLVAVDAAGAPTLLRLPSPPQRY